MGILAYTNNYCKYIKYGNHQNAVTYRVRAPSLPFVGAAGAKSLTAVRSEIAASSVDAVVSPYGFRSHNAGAKRSSAGTGESRCNHQDIAAKEPPGIPADAAIKILPRTSSPADVSDPKR
jgi:hypothetical protein